MVGDDSKHSEQKWMIRAIKVSHFWWLRWSLIYSNINYSIFLLFYLYLLASRLRRAANLADCFSLGARLMISLPTYLRLCRLYDRLCHCRWIWGPHPIRCRFLHCHHHFKSSYFSSHPFRYSVSSSILLLKIGSGGAAIHFFFILQQHYPSSCESFHYRQSQGSQQTELSASF